MASPAALAHFIAVLDVVLPEYPVLEVENIPGDAQALPPTWSAILPGTAQEERIALGSGLTHRESGTILVALYVETGTGTTAVLAAAEALRDALRDYMSGHFRVRAVDPAMTLDREDGRFLGAVIPLDYTFDC